MTQSFYGNHVQTIADDETARKVEDLRVRGFTTLSGLCAGDELAEWRTKIDTVYNQQEREFGRDRLVQIEELDMCRAPLLYDFSFVKLATIDRVQAILRSLLGEWFILHLQNGVINRPGASHHQAAWHRDLPHQNYISSRPLALSVLLTIDNFTEETGGTQVLPFTHKQEALPSAEYITENALTLAAESGSAIIFDSMLFHRAGRNSSASIRRGVNHVYTVPMIKQQYDFRAALKDSRLSDGPELQRLLGFASGTALDDKAFRQARIKRIGKGSTEGTLL